MPTMQWEWKISLGTVFSAAQLFAVLLGVAVVWGKAQSEQTTSQATVAELKAIVSTLTAAQSTAAERVTKVETKVDLMLPAIQRIEARQMSERLK